MERAAPLPCKNNERQTQNFIPPSHTSFSHTLQKYSMLSAEKRVLLIFSIESHLISKHKETSQGNKVYLRNFLFEPAFNKKAPKDRSGDKKTRR